MGARLVIGIGHPDRGDDAVGRVVAARLREQRLEGVEVREHDGEATTLIEWLGGADEAILVDAALSDAEPGTVQRFDVATAVLPRARFGLSTHGIGLADAVELARSLGQLPRRCIVFAVEARSFLHGESLSREVEEAVAEVVRRVVEEIQQKDRMHA